MMIPEIISEFQTNYDDGSYIKGYIVKASDWAIQLNGEYYIAGQTCWSPKIENFVISESTRMGYLETLVFPADEEGNRLRPMYEIAGGRGHTADEILTCFGKIMLENGYDTV